MNGNNNISVYPNPLSTGAWILQADNLLGAFVTVYDETGKEVYRSLVTATTMQIDFNAARGVYLLRITSKENYYSAKLVKL